MLNIGLTSRTLHGTTVAEAADTMQRAGFRATELTFTHTDLDGWRYNGMGDLTGITGSRVRAACDEFRHRGIEVVSLGMFTDLRNPDKGVRQKHIDYAKRYIDFAASADVRYIATECGFTEGHRGISDITYESDYQNLKDSLREICLEAGKAGVQIALEGSVFDIIPSPRRQKTLIEELESECHVRLSTLLDPASYIHNSDEEGMFYYLKHDIGYVHG